MRPQRKARHPSPPPSGPLKKPTHWNNVADWYDRLVGDEGSEYHQQVIIPGVLKMLNLQPDERVLDLACGQGVLCRAMAQTQARVTGVDAAAALIDAAKTRAGPITYFVADATKLLVPESPLAALRSGFDAITCVFAIQNLTPLSPVWQGCKALLKPGGRLIVVMMHPCFRIPKQSGWGWDEKTHSQYRRVEQYLTSGKTEIQMKPGELASGGPGQTTTTFHRPLQAYFNTLGSAGLLVDHIAEWTSHKTNQPGPKKEALEKSRREIPMFLAIRARVV